MEELTSVQKTAKEQLQTIFFRPRNSGRTSQMLEGLRAATQPVICICHSAEVADDYKRTVHNKNVRFISLRQLEELRSDKSPVVVDHWVMEDLLHRLFEGQL